jgi:hypothetical protein
MHTHPEAIGQSHEGVAEQATSAAQPPTTASVDSFGSQPPITPSGTPTITINEAVHPVTLEQLSSAVFNLNELDKAALARLHNLNLHGQEQLDDYEQLIQDADDDAYPKFFGIEVPNPESLIEQQKAEILVEAYSKLTLREIRTALEWQLKYKKVSYPY